MVKKTAPKLDAFGLFLPSRMGPTLSQDLLQKGLKLDEAAAEGDESDATTASVGATAQKDSSSSEDEKESDDAELDDAEEDDEVDDVDQNMDDTEAEDYYDEEYYDDEDEL